MYEWKKFQAFCEQQVNGYFNVMNVPAATLDKLLGKFFKDVRKQNGGEYEPDSISSFQKSIQRHLKELKLPLNILQDEEFRRSREVLAAKRKNLVKQGRGNKPNACRELTTEEEEKLFESGEFGCHNPEALQCTLWWFFSLHFGFRARDESRKLCWGDLELQNDPEAGKEVLVWMAERGSKTRKGMEGAHQRQFNPKIFATGTERCRVRFFKLFESHRPEKAKAPSYPFFLAINHKGWREKPNGWYKLSPLGKNQIGKFLPKAAQKAGLQACGKKIANHSVRKTSISRLLDGGTPENFVAQLSGHKNLQSLSSYKSASITHQRKMSDILQQQSSRPGLSPNAPNFVSVDGTSSQQSSFAQQKSFSFQAMPHPSLFASANIGSISNCVFNLVQSAPSDASGSLHENSAKHQKLDSNR
jgi:integrase